MQRILKLQAEHPTARWGRDKLYLTDHRRERCFTLDTGKERVPRHYESCSESSGLWLDDPANYDTDDPQIIDPDDEEDFEEPEYEETPQDQRESKLQRLFSKPQSWVTQLRLEVAPKPRWVPERCYRCWHRHEDEDEEGEEEVAVEVEVYRAPFWDFVKRPVPKHRRPLSR